jgi:7-carboxy-7-deazaguanine synthase
MNPLRSSAPTTSTLWVQEVFTTIQGEGPFTGLPCVFVRLAGCNLACHFCDTDFESSKWNPTYEELFARISDEFRDNINRKMKRLVVISGGEPFRQNMIPLIEQLVDDLEAHVQIETAGTLWNIGLWRFVSDKSVTIVCSPKTPSLNSEIKNAAEHFKYIVRAGETDEETGLPCYSTQREGLKLRKTLYKPDRGTIWLQPQDEHEPFANQRNLEACVALCIKHGYRISYQLHKIAGIP